MWTVLVTEIASIGIADHPPVLVRDDILQRDVVLPHQGSRQLRGALYGSREIAVAILAHLDSDR